MKHTLNTLILPATPADFPELVAVWEKSVRATHHFLCEHDIALYKPLTSATLPLMDVYMIRDLQGKIALFAAVSGVKLEMLFSRPDSIGKGLGKYMVQHLIVTHGIREVDVNEQNESAVGFYLHMGFIKTSRDMFDSAGRPYPILHMTYSGATKNGTV